MDKKTDSSRIFPDRFLTGERDEGNPYLTAALYFLVGLMSLMLILVVFVSMCRVDGESMLDTHKDGDHVLLYKFADEFSHGDVIVFDVELGGKTDRLIKRVIGLPGDELLFVREADADTVVLYRKAAGTETFALLGNADADSAGKNYEAYIKEPMKASKFDKDFAAKYLAPDATDASMEKYRYLVDEGCLFVMGDNRNDSTDSRVFGQIPESVVVGKEIFHFTQGSLLEKIMLVIFNSGHREVQ